jgi:hypothetical protein
VTRNVAELITQNASRLCVVLLHSREPVFVFAERWKNGERWPPIILYPNGILDDGAHRLLAAFLLGHETIETT